MKITKNIFLITITSILLTTTTFAQDKYKIVNSSISFFSEAPMEDIVGKTTKAVGIVVFEKQQFSFRIPINTFDFDSDLMREHFNENYLESDKYANASYKGTFDGDYDLKKDGVYTITSKGTLNIHGVDKQVEIPATVTVTGVTIKIDTKFNIKIEEYGIEIPTLLFKKIAEVVEVTVAGELVKL